MYHETNHSRFSFIFPFNRSYAFFFFYICLNVFVAQRRHQLPRFRPEPEQTALRATNLNPPSPTTAQVIQLASAPFRGPRRVLFWFTEERRRIPDGSFSAVRYQSKLHSSRWTFLRTEGGFLCQNVCRIQQKTPRRVCFQQHLHGKDNHNVSFLQSEKCNLIF